VSRSRIGELQGLQHEFCDVSEEGTLADIYLSVGDGAKKLGEDGVDLGGGLGIGRIGQDRREASGFRGLPAVAWWVQGAVGRQRRACGSGVGWRRDGCSVLEQAGFAG